MAYKKTVWVEGETPLSPRNMNNIEEGIEAQEAALEAHKAETAPHGLEPLSWIAGAVTALHNDAQGNLERMDESVSGVLRRRTTLAYVNGSLATVNVKLYSDDGVTIAREWTDTLTYASGELTTVTRMVIK